MSPSGSNTDPPVGVRIPPPHSEYYLRGGDLHVIAGNTLFRVHGYFFARDSPIFRTKLNPVSPGQTKQGTSPDSPVVLDGITAKEFEKLLWVFYNPKYSLYDADVGTWKSLLNLANKLEFKEVKELAVRELHMKKELPLVDKMALYEAHQVDRRHLVPLFAELCARDTPLTLEESIILGPESTYLVYSARERLRSQDSDGGRSPLPPGLEEQEVFHTIETLLGLENGSTLEFHRLEENAHGPTEIITVQARVTVLRTGEVAEPFYSAHQGHPSASDGDNFGGGARYHPEVLLLTCDSSSKKSMGNLITT